MYEALISTAPLWCKVVVYGTIVPAFLWMTYTGVREMAKLHEASEDGRFIYGEELHNVEHFAVFGFSILLMFWMVAFENNLLPQEYFGHMSMLAFFQLFLFPHLIEER